MGVARPPARSPARPRETDAALSPPCSLPHSAHAPPPCFLPLLGSAKDSFLGCVSSPPRNCNPECFPQPGRVGACAADQPRLGQPMLDDVPISSSPPILVDMPSELAAAAAAERDGRKGIHCGRCVTGMSSCPPISLFSSAESRERGRLRLPLLPQSGRLAGRQLYNVRMSVGRRKWRLLVCSTHARPCPHTCPPTRRIADHNHVPLTRTHAAPAPPRSLTLVVPIFPHC